MKEEDYKWLLDAFPGSSIQPNGEGGILLDLPANARCVQSVTIPAGVTIQAHGGIEVGTGVTVSMGISR